MSPVHRRYWCNNRMSTTPSYRDAPRPVDQDAKLHRDHSPSTSRTHAVLAHMCPLRGSNAQQCERATSSRRIFALTCSLASIAMRFTPPPLSLFHALVWHVCLFLNAYTFACSLQFWHEVPPREYICWFVPRSFGSHASSSSAQHSPRPSP